MKKNLLLRNSFVEFTIYTKSNCSYCSKVKQLLHDHKIEYVEINCDKYLIDDKVLFLSYIKSVANKEHNTFPMVFNKKVFIGGYTDTVKYIEKEYVDFNDYF
jgi:glutaredoxin